VNVARIAGESIWYDPTEQPSLSMLSNETRNRTTLEESNVDGCRHTALWLTINRSLSQGAGPAGDTKYTIKLGTVTRVFGLC